MFHVLSTCILFFSPIGFSFCYLNILYLLLPLSVRTERKDSIMAEHDPKQAITEYVGLPLGIVQPNPPFPVPAQGQRFQGELRRGGGLGAQEGTIHFFQERRLSDRQLHEITFEDEAGQHQHWLCFVVQDQQGGWHMVGGANYSDDPRHKA